MKFSRLSAVCLAVVVMASAAAMAGEWKFDFGTLDSNSTATVASGCIRIDAMYHDYTGYTYGTHGNPYDLGSGITAGFANSYYSGVFNEESLPYGWAGTSFEPFANAASIAHDAYGNSGFNVMGLPDGLYTIELASWEPLGASTVTNWRIDFGTGSVDLVTGPDDGAYNLASITAIANVTLSSGAANVIKVIPMTSTSYYWVPLNYVTISEVPEPATLSLLGLGAAALIRRRAR